jgi:hypothetical protein
MVQDNKGAIQQLTPDWQRLCQLHPERQLIAGPGNALSIG